MTVRAEINRQDLERGSASREGRRHSAEQGCLSGNSEGRTAKQLPDSKDVKTANKLSALCRKLHQTALHRSANGGNGLVRLITVPCVITRSNETEQPPM